ncbi:MAG: DUF4265 domain-containing protein [Sinobacterium sp.]|nr:DUF4265 domain-containing protein [Sinobacterium sp.]
MSPPKKIEAEAIHVLAGQRPDGELVYEQVLAKSIGDECYRLETSLLFAKGAAKGDTIRLLQAGRFEVEQHGGNLCIRVVAKDNIEVIRARLQSTLMKLDAACDYSNDRSLVYSVHVSKGFDVIEKAMNEAFVGQEDNAMWQYANVYDAMDGQTPLNWWHDFLAK